MNNTTDPLYFDENGKFRIMHLTDSHLSYDNLENSLWLIADAVDREKPNLVVYTGDIFKAKTVEESEWFIDRIMSVFEKRNVPVAITFGNHDSELGVLTREELMAIYNRYSCSISIDDGEELSGCGTYNIPIYSKSDEKMKFNLWIFDSGSYDEERHYANVLEDQVEWYRQTSEKYEKKYGRKINSLVFQHIIVPEIYDALEKVEKELPYSYKHCYSDEYYMFNSKLENHGILHETPCPGYYNHGQFEAMVDRGDVLGMFFGHDHTNSFTVKYKGINITNSLSSRFNDDARSTQFGYRLIDLDESDTSTYETKSFRWYDQYSFLSPVKLKRAGDNQGAMLIRKIKSIGFSKKYSEIFNQKKAKLITGRTVCYKE